MISLDRFEQDLAALIGEPTDLRPFVCDGSPLHHRAFIVGFNPATEMAADFWSFWRHGFGFDKSAWLAAYLKERRERPLKPGKSRRAAMSNTRRVLEWVLQEAEPVRCLETNIYAAPTEQAAGLAPARRLTAPFDFLLDAIRPDLIVVHGKEAAMHMGNRGVATPVIAVPHFSRGWSQSAARELGRQIRHGCNT